MRIYCDEKVWNNTDDGLGDAWNAVGAIGASAVQLLPGLFSGGGSSAGGPARGLAAIRAAVDQALSSLNQILQQVRGGQMAAAAGASEAQRIAAALSNPQYVYQAQRGDDAAALNQGKQQAAAIVAQIQALAGNTTPIGGGVNTGGVSPVDTAAGGSAQAPAASAAGGIDTSTLLLLGGGLALILLLK